MKKRNKILTSITLIFIMLFSYMVPLVPVVPVYAAEDDPVETMDFSVIKDGNNDDPNYLKNQLPSKASYGTLFWTEGTEISIVEQSSDAIELVTNQPYHYDTEGWTKIKLPRSETTSETENELKVVVKITKCALDENGQLCDVICELSDFKKLTGVNYINTDPEFHEFWIGKHPAFPLSTYLLNDQDQVHNYKQGSNLIEMWFEIRKASVNFSMKYVLTGTETAAKITKAASTVFDIDVDTNITGAEWNGCEGFTTNNAKAKIYYNKSDNGWLTDVVEDEKTVGVRIKDPDGTLSTYIPENYMNKIDSAVVVEELENATYKLFYSGTLCGIGWVFASPFSYQLDEPVKTIVTEKVENNVTVKEEKDYATVFENENFIYRIKQYVPGNYFSDLSNFTGEDQIGGKYSSFVIEDQLDSHIEITGDITIKNESGKDVTDLFNITTQDNKVTLAAKNDTMSKESFYAHFYNIDIPVKVTITDDTGNITDVIKNKAKTIAVNNLSTTDNPEIKESDEVRTDLKYNVVINAEIDHGTTKINTGEEHQTTTYSDGVNRGENSSNTVYFTVADGYQVASITIDGNASPLSGWTLTNGTYSLNIDDENINENIEHNVIIVTEKKDGQVIVRHVDESDHEIASSVTKTGKVGDQYETEAKTITGYELKTTPGNATGEYAENPITVTYVYKKKDASVIVKYIDATTNQEFTEATETITGKVGDPYETEEKSFENYELVSTPTNATGNMAEEQIEVDYFYRPIGTTPTPTPTGEVTPTPTPTPGSEQDAVIIVNYIDEDGKQLTKSETKTGKIGDRYTTEQKEFKGYELKEVPSNANGEITEKNTIVNYVYKLKPAKVIIRHVDKEGNKVANDVTLNGMFFAAYDTSSKEIPNYNLIKVPTNASGTMNQEETIVTYVYDLKSAQVVVNYLDENGKKLADSETITGKVTQDYATTPKEIKEYKVSKTPSNAKGKMTENTIVVNYIYEKTTADKILPNTGYTQRTIVILGSIAILATIGIMTGIKIKKYKGI